jgi:hypothetical protein
MNRMSARGRYAGRKATEQREWVHVDGVGAISVGLAQLDANQTIGQKVQALLTEGRAKDVLA